MQQQQPLHSREATIADDANTRVRRSTGSLTPTDSLNTASLRITTLQRYADGEQQNAAHGVTSAHAEQTPTRGKPSWGSWRRLNAHRSTLSTACCLRVEFATLWDRWVRALEQQLFCHYAKLVWYHYCIGGPVHSFTGHCFDCSASQIPQSWNKGVP